MYASFINRGIHVFTSGSLNRKAFDRARNVRQCHEPSRKPLFPVPEFGI